MDAHGHIYMADEDLIPEPDKARLDGFLRGRAESDAIRAATEEEVAELRAEVERLRRQNEHPKSAFR